tara:strand:+ start:207 stop:425 length:219 start_codon:yes stop_codon:yes gene_type:complete
MAIEYKKLKYPPEMESGAVRTDYVCKIVTDDNGDVVTDSWIPVDTNPLMSVVEYKEYLIWEAIDGNTISEPD